MGTYIFKLRAFLAHSLHGILSDASLFFNNLHCTSKQKTNTVKLIDFLEKIMYIIYWPWLDTKVPTQLWYTGAWALLFTVHYINTLLSPPGGATETHHMAINYSQFQHSALKVRHYTAAGTSFMTPQCLIRWVLGPTPMPLCSNVNWPHGHWSVVPGGHETGSGTWEMIRISTKKEDRYPSVQSAVSYHPLSWGPWSPSSHVTRS